MHFQAFWALCLGATTAHAFRDTSPFMFFSTSELLFDSPQITTATSIVKSISSALNTCPSQYYVLLRQSGVHSGDYSRDGSVPHLQRRLAGEDKTVRSSSSAAEVRGDVDRQALVDELREHCGADVLELKDTSSVKPMDKPSGSVPKVIVAELQAPPATGKDRSLRLRENDLWLSYFLQALPSLNYTVIYTTTPQAASADAQEEQSYYQMDSVNSPLDHMELKRDLDAHAQAAGNITLVDGPLFERYQYLTPGIFMGLLVLFFLGSILYVAINAVASLQVSYAAFDKENGPQAQKKQQ